jgi:predicted  nucleic acid-binding Zn-ribbon protein
MPNGRCHKHGGATPIIKTQIMRSSKSEYLPKALYARFETLNGSVLDNLEESIRLQQTMETSIVERLDHLRAQLEQAREVVYDAARSFAIQTQLRHELQDIQESQRKLSETLTKCRKEMQETYTKEQWNVLLLAALTSLKKHVEAAALAAVAQDFQAFDTTKLLRGKV